MSKEDQGGSHFSHFYILNKPPGEGVGIKQDSAVAEFTHIYDIVVVFAFAFPALMVMPDLFYPEGLTILFHKSVGSDFVPQLIGFPALHSTKDIQRRIV